MNNDNINNPDSLLLRAARGIITQRPEQLAQQGIQMPDYISGTKGFTPHDSDEVPTRMAFNYKTGGQANESPESFNRRLSDWNQNQVTKTNAHMEMMKHKFWTMAHGMGVKLER